ncbi:MAG TPA: nitroreductase family protein [Thermoanaerobacterales bacterium]|jgi:nitroreductase|nr:nitroreductase family protein [Thermoanaerobacterales bacterium]
MNEVVKLLKERRSIREYIKKPISREILEDIIDCGRLAPSARNIQPWLFVVVTEQEGKQQLANLATHGKFIADAAACVAVFCERDQQYFLEDGSAATQNIIIAAKSYGIDSCWVAGNGKEYAEDVREFLNVPENYTLISLISLGYSDKTAERSKKQLSEVLKWEKYK